MHRRWDGSRLLDLQNRSEIELRPRLQLYSAMNYRVQESDLFGATADPVARGLSSYIALTALKFYGFSTNDMHYNMDFECVSLAVLMENKSTRLELYRLVRPNYPVDPTMGEHDMFVKWGMRHIYEHYFSDSLAHIAFVQVCAFAVEVIVHIMNYGYRTALCRRTMWLLACTFCGREFHRMTGLEDVISYCTTAVRNALSQEGWQRFSEIVGDRRNARGVFCHLAVLSPSEN